MKEVLRSHVLYVVMDTKFWEQSTTYHIDSHDKVKNCETLGGPGAGAERGEGP